MPKKHFTFLFHFTDKLDLLCMVCWRDVAGRVRGGGHQQGDLREALQVDGGARQQVARPHQASGRLLHRNPRHRRLRNLLGKNPGRPHHLPAHHDRAREHPTLAHWRHHQWPLCNCIVIGFAYLQDSRFPLSLLFKHIVMFHTKTVIRYSTAKPRKCLTHCVAACLVFAVEHRVSRLSVMFSSKYLFFRFFPSALVLGSFCFSS